MSPVLSAAKCSGTVHVLELIRFFGSGFVFLSFVCGGKQALSGRLIFRVCCDAGGSRHSDMHFSLAADPLEDARGEERRGEERRGAVNQGGVTLLIYFSMSFLARLFHGRSLLERRLVEDRDVSFCFPPFE